MDRKDATPAAGVHIEKAMDPGRPTEPLAVCKGHSWAS